MTLEDKNVLPSALIAGATALLLAGLAFFDRAAFFQLNAEDGPVEWATFAAFITAAIGFSLCLKAPRPWLEKAGLVALIVFCVVVAGEEISWGQRLFGIQPPDLFLEKNFQQEMNVHNLLNKQTFWGMPLDSRFLIALICMVCGALLPLLSLVKMLDGVLPLTSWRPPLVAIPLFMGVALAEVTYPVKFGGESAELVFGLTFAVWAVGLHFRLEMPRRFSFLWTAIPLGLGLVLTPITDAVTSRAGAHLIPTAKMEAEKMAEVLATMPVWTRKIATTPRLHQRFFTARKKGYFRKEVLEAGLENRDLVDALPRHKYFIDPWANPYWVIFDHRARETWIYSFGPNRRRDTEVPGGQKIKPAGDDIFIFVQARKR